MAVDTYMFKTGLPTTHRMNPAVKLAALGLNNALRIGPNVTPLVSWSMEGTGNGEGVMTCAGAFPHRPKSSDFLLVRSAAGSLSVRRLTGSIVLGQQEPLMRIPSPKSKESK